MRAVIQRVKKAEVKIQEKSVGKIEEGLLILLGIHEKDTLADVDYLVRKISKLRIFEDENNKMNYSVQDIRGSILSVSQFTLYADTKKGNRPSFVEAKKPEQALLLYEQFNQKLIEENIYVQTGEFGADMAVSLINDGPVTIVIDTLEK